VGALLCAALSGCLGMPDLSSTGAIPADGEAANERAAAVAEMRAEAANVDHLPYPDAFLAGQTTRLAAREEPMTEAQVEAIQTELAAIAAQRAQTTNTQEIAALETRARELRKLVLSSSSEQVRR
jgi:hypothetical protein